MNIDAIRQRYPTKKFIQLISAPDKKQAFVVRHTRDFFELDTSFLYCTCSALAGYSLSFQEWIRKERPDAYALLEEKVDLYPLSHPTVMLALGPSDENTEDMIRELKKNYDKKH